MHPHLRTAAVRQTEVENGMPAYRAAIANGTLGCSRGRSPKAGLPLQR